MEGKSLQPILRGQTAELYPEVYGYWHRSEYTAALPTQRMVRTDRWKLIYYSNLDRYRLFDLARDPHELDDLSDDLQHAPTRAALRRKLEAWFAPRRSSNVSVPAGTVLDFCQDCAQPAASPWPRSISTTRR